MALGEARGTPSRSWSERLVEASGWPPFGASLALGCALVAVFLALSFAVGRLPLLLSGEAPVYAREDLRIGIVLLGAPFETYWHRLMLLVIAWFAGRGVLATVVEARRFSQLGQEVRIELLDPAPQRTLARQSLHTALLVIGALSIVLLMFYDVAAAPQLGWTLTLVGAGSVSLAGLAFGLPLRGLHDAVVAAKRQELSWCNAAIREARRALVDGHASAGPRGLADLVAYRGVVESVREWPLDAPALRRFALYCVIPLASRLGGAGVERLVDALLD